MRSDTLLPRLLGALVAVLGLLGCSSWPCAANQESKVYACSGTGKGAIVGTTTEVSLTDVSALGYMGAAGAWLCDGVTFDLVSATERCRVQVSFDCTKSASMMVGSDDVTCWPTLPDAGSSVISSGPGSFVSGTLTVTPADPLSATFDLTFQAAAGGDLGVSGTLESSNCRTEEICDS
jgi:hypothetical protein